ncbi:MAG: deiodinase-like protein [Gammaproteobacteria bacterium]
MSYDYRFQHLKTGIIMDDMRFGKSSLKAGNEFPEFNLATVTGNSIGKTDFAGTKPMLLIFGSASCPMTVSTIPVLKRLYKEFGADVEFVTLYVREAHPGEYIPQPQTAEEKHKHAFDFQSDYELPWTVAVDDIDGRLHQVLDPKPNAAFLMGSDGKIAFRSLWAGDETALRAALQAISGGEKPSKPQSTAMFGPISRGIGVIDQVLAAAGPRAQREMWFAAPPLAIMAKLVSLVRSIFQRS